MRNKLIQSLKKITAKYHHSCWANTDKIADYLLADGWIKLPCKVGDTVWFDTYKKSGTVSLGIQPHKVDRIDIICVVGEKELVETRIHDWCFGDSVFFTKEEAEAKLKEREEK